MSNITSVSKGEQIGAKINSLIVRQNGGKRIITVIAVAIALCIALINKTVAQTIILMSRILFSIMSVYKVIAYT